MTVVKIKVVFTEYITVSVGRSYFFGVVNVFNIERQFTGWEDAIKFIRSVSYD